MLEDWTPICLNGKRDPDRLLPRRLCYLKIAPRTLGLPWGGPKLLLA